MDNKHKGKGEIKIRPDKMMLDKLGLTPAGRKRKLKKHAIKLGLILGGIVVAVLAVVVPLGMLALNNPVDCDPSADLTGGSSGSGGASGQWTQKGTQEYKNAQEVFKRLTKDLGLSGAAAAGVMGNIAHESGFNTSATNPSDGGKGLIQWTFARESQLEEFAKKAGKPWTDLSVQIKMLETDMKNPVNWVSGKYHDNSLVKFGTDTDPQDAASRFYISQMEAGGGYSYDPDGTEGTRRQGAETAYKLFNGSSVKADKSKLESESGGKSSGSGGTDTSADGSTDCEAPTGDWGWPFKSIKGKPQISGAQLFGHVGGGRPNGFHDGIDFGTSPYNNQDIVAIHGGKVYKIDHEGTTQNDLGWYVCVKSDDGYYEVYQEFAFSPSDKDAISVKVGDTVKTGDKIGTLSSKYTNVDHVHVGVTKKEITLAEASAYKDDGTWIDWSKLVEDSK